MADSIRQQIMTAFEARLATITTGNGYSSNLGKNVFGWRKTTIGQNEMPCVIVRDLTAKVTYDDAPIGHVNNRLQVMIEALFTGALTAAQARNALNDLISAIGTDPRFGGLVLETHILEHELDLQAAEHISGGVSVTVEMVYRTARWQA